MTREEAIAEAAKEANDRPQTVFIISNIGIYGWGWGAREASIFTLPGLYVVASYADPWQYERITDQEISESLSLYAGATA